MNQELKQRLQELYIQKADIEKEIRKIEFELSQTFSTNEKIEIFANTFLHNFTQQNKYETIKNHLLGIETILFDFSQYAKINFINFSIDSRYTDKAVSKLAQKGVFVHYEHISTNTSLCWIFFEYDYDISMLESVKTLILEYLNHSILEFYPKLILPLSLNDIQKNYRLFIDSKTQKPYNPQWNFLKNIKKTPHYTLQTMQNKAPSIILNNSIIIPNNINFEILNEIKSYLTFDNPMYETLLKLRKPIFNTPKKLKNFTHTKTELIVPRGIKDKVLEIFHHHKQPYKLIDKRVNEPQTFWNVVFTLRDDQNRAINAISSKEYGICVAPPGFGKTLIGAKMIELRSCSTLILVNKNMLLDQWIQRLSEYFWVDKSLFGFLGKGKNSLNGKLDIATIQSLKNNESLIAKYSFLIIDECHHIPAYSFESIIKKFCGKYVLGLSATPHRKDALEPLLFHQVGNIVYSNETKSKSKNQIVMLLKSDFSTQSTDYTQILAELINDKNRNTLIIEQVKKYKNRNIILLSDRVEHLQTLEELLRVENIEFTTIHGSQSKKEQNINKTKLDTSRLILSSSSYFGEGVDLEHLDTIIFATPISYYGRIIQYLGRVGRSDEISDTLCIDILDANSPILLSTYKKRKEGFIKLGYKIQNH
ncbi:DEAD/DEAH box helicase [Arcobacter sp. FWKO B]|uniref:DEAD/DEAH box helicase n=1 Tax=Arcobacter sp. FWKO B TaxID=2593672 RepID=UPI0018A52940|nr:DEAD/DEAH box helicase [Arcobacter sp. FWKO B]QOG12112.1 DEAD/DEAH box helicase [Arcobacter sp. FWKO B]